MKYSEIYDSNLREFPLRSQEAAFNAIKVLHDPRSPSWRYSGLGVSAKPRGKGKGGTQANRGNQRLVAQMEGQCRYSCDEAGNVAKYMRAWADIIEENDREDHVAPVSEQVTA